ncbi:MAG: hypothetical protein R3F19_16145 [Verrucomicrobiales bacterium]
MSDSNAIDFETERREAFDKEFTQLLFNKGVSEKSFHWHWRWLCDWGQYRRQRARESKELGTREIFEEYLNR